MLKKIKGETMKKVLLVLVFSMLACNLSCANGFENGIFDNYFSNEERMLETLKPSFDCSKVKTDTAEEYICNSTMYGMATGPTLMFIDNFFTSYYNAIIKSIPQEQKAEIKKIAKKAMKERDKAYKASLYDCEKGHPNNVEYQVCMIEYIEEPYSKATREITQYLSKNNQEDLLNSIFSGYTRLISKQGMYGFLMEMLYADKLVDETGKLTLKETQYKGGIFDNYYSNEKRMRETLKPSFDCSKAREESEKYICDFKPHLIFMDNLFSSYYNIVLKNVPLEQKAEIKKIAKEAMKERDKERRYAYEHSDIFIFYNYKDGIKEITQYLSKNNQKDLLKNIFSNYTKEITDIGATFEILDLLYKNKIIDETGKIIGNRIKCNFIEKIGTLYNALAKEKVSSYGKILEYYYNNESWLLKHNSIIQNTMDYLNRKSSIH